MSNQRQGGQRGESSVSEMVERVLGEAAPAGGNVRWWQRVDSALRKLASEQANRDYTISLLLVEAEKARVFVPLGMTSVYEYASALFGWNRRQVEDRLRMAKALAALPVMSAEFAAGRRPWTAVRSLARVAVAETEQEWLDETKGWSVSQIEEKVAMLHRGARPHDPPDPELMRLRLRFNLSGQTMALYKEVRDKLRREVDSALSDEDILRLMCERALGGPVDEGRAPYQVGVVVCEHCQRTWQQGGGESYELDPIAAECATCDAQHIGRIDSPPAGPNPPHVGGKTPPASQTIPPATRRKIIRRDCGRCKLPSCRSSGWVHVHHVDLVSEGGAHDPDLLLTLCSAHHRAHHRGFICIEALGGGRFAFTHADGTPFGSPPTPRDVQASVEAFQALRGLGFKEGESRRLVEAARGQVGIGASLEELIRAALRLSRAVDPRVGIERRGG